MTEAGGTPQPGAPVPAHGPAPQAPAPQGPAPWPAQGPAPGAGRGPWPLAPLTVPVALVLATLVSGAFTSLVITELPWGDRLEGGGLFTFAFVFGFALTSVLVLLGFVAPARPSVPRAGLGTIATAFAFGIVALLADAITSGFDRFAPFLPPGEFFTDHPVQVALNPYQLMMRTFSDVDLLQIDLFDTPIFLTAAIAFGVMMGLVGLGATFASGGKLLSAVLAAIGAAGGAFVGEVFVQYGSLEWPRSFFDQRGPTLLVLIPIVLSGIGMGLGALLGRGRAAPSTGAPGSFAGYPAPPQPVPAQQVWTPAGSAPAAQPPDGPPPGATTF